MTDSRPNELGTVPGPLLCTKYCGGLIRLGFLTLRSSCSWATGVGIHELQDLGFISFWSWGSSPRGVGVHELQELWFKPFRSWGWRDWVLGDPELQEGDSRLLKAAQCLQPKSKASVLFRPSLRGKAAKLLTRMWLKESFVTTHTLFQV